MMTPQRGYIKDIIEEYNLRFPAWGHSDSWGLTEFKMLEDLIYKSSRMRINANTLKRFFQQRTSNPQIATNNALCVFLGYSGYAEFVMKKTQQQEKQETKPITKPDEPDVPAAPAVPPKLPIKKNRSAFRRYLRYGIYPTIIIIGIIVLLTGSMWDILKEKYEDHLFASVVFQSSLTKGASPFTTKIQCNIPDHLMNEVSIDCVEANGDLNTRKLTKDQHDFYATFIYPGTAYCHLKYKNRIIRTIAVESRTRGWSTYIKEDRMNFYQSFAFSQAETSKGYLTLPVEEIPSKAITDKLFVSYTYYTDSIIDGDNFIAEARVRNSAVEDHGIPCYDMMMYVFSNTGLHGFSLNENCYSYLKFISSEQTMMGDHHDLSRFNFNPSVWHTMRIEVVNKHTTFFIDGDEILKMNYQQSLGAVNELTFRFKGCGAVDYVKIMNLQQKIVYEEDFN
jgi:hypothetical protein